MLSTRDMRHIRKWIKKLEKRRTTPNISKSLPLPYPILGSGLNRRVYDLGNRYVLKVALTKKGIKDTIMEQLLSRQAPKKARKYLGEVILGGRGWLIMEKYYLIVPETFDYDRKVYRMIRRLRRYGILPSDIITKRAKRILRNNLRLKANGKLIVIDYGNFSRLKNKYYKNRKKPIQ